MARRRPTRLAVLAATLLLACLGASAGPLDDAMRARLGNGEILVDVLPGEPMPFLTMRGVVDAPPAAVWDVVSHCGLYRGRMPRIVDSEELASDGGRVRCRTVVETAWPMSNLTSITRALHTVAPGVWKREWALESGDYVFNEGSWTLTPFDDAATRTLVVYRLHAEAKVPVPLVMQQIAQKHALPETLEAVRRVVGESKAHPSPGAASEKAR
ncbi:MAG TPA: SRPBCC family protein [Myxococcota bacterium]|nr:SRPBCC family protein [Myxococcota bacterium]